VGDVLMDWSALGEDAVVIGEVRAR
jgi:hypothetical protein